MKNIHITIRLQSTRFLEPNYRCIITYQCKSLETSHAYSMNTLFESFTIFTRERKPKIGPAQKNEIGSRSIHALLKSTHFTLVGRHPIEWIKVKNDDAINTEFYSNRAMMMAAIMFQMKLFSVRSLPYCTHCACRSFNRSWNCAVADGEISLTENSSYIIILSWHNSIQ